MTFKIDDDIPLPAVRCDPRRRDHYPFAEMRVGQSFKVPAAEAKKVKLVRSSLHHHVRKEGRERPLRRYVVLRVLGEEETDGIAGFRVWREADAAVEVDPRSIPMCPEHLEEG